MIVEVLQRVCGRVSGAEVKFHYWQTFSFRDGSLTASHMADTRSDALKPWSYGSRQSRGRTWRSSAGSHLHEMGAHGR